MRLNGDYTMTGGDSRMKDVFECILCCGSGYYTINRRELSAEPLLLLCDVPRGRAPKNEDNALPKRIEMDVAKIEAAINYPRVERPIFKHEAGKGNDT